MTNPYIRALDGSYDVTTRGPLLYSAIEADSMAEAAARAIALCAFPAYATGTGDHWIFAGDKLRAGIPSVALDLAALRVATGTDATVFYWSLESSKLSSVRYGSAGAAMFSGMASRGIIGVGEIRVDSGLTPDAFLDLMISEESEKAGPAKRKLAQWLGDRSVGLRQYTRYASGTLKTSVPVVKTAAGWHVADPKGVVRCRIPGDTLLIGSSAGRVVDVADAGDVVRAWLDAYDARLNGSEVDTTIPPMLTSASGAAQAALFNQRLASAAIDYDFESSVPLTSGHSLLLWYGLMATVARQDDSIDDFVQRMGYKSLRAAFVNAIPDPQYVGIKA